MFRDRVASIVRFRHLSAGALAVLLCLGAAQVRAQQPAAAAQARSGFQTRLFKDDAGDHKYMVFVPAGYTVMKPLAVG